MGGDAEMADRFEYTVEGVGDFPLDMLRHDCAYPADQESVTAIMAGLRWVASRKRSRETMVVRLVCPGFERSLAMSGAQALAPAGVPCRVQPSWRE